MIGNFRHEFASQGCVFAIPGCIFCTFGVCIWYFGCAHFGREITSNFALIDFPLYDNWPFWEEPRFVTGRPTFLEMIFPGDSENIIGFNGPRGSMGV